MAVRPIYREDRMDVRGMDRDSREEKINLGKLLNAASSSRSSDVLGSGTKQIPEMAELSIRGRRRHPLSSVQTSLWALACASQGRPVCKARITSNISLKQIEGQSCSGGYGQPRIGP